MKPELKNFTGTINNRYRIAEESKVNDYSTQVNLYYEIINPVGSDWHTMDSAHGIGKNYAEAMKKALQSAERKWGLQLIKKEQLKTA